MLGVEEAIENTPYRYSAKCKSFTGEVMAITCGVNIVNDKRGGFYQENEK